MSAAAEGSPLDVLVLGGGPDRERDVSLRSAARVAAALREAGHRVREAEVGPDDLAALEPGADVVFPVLHGPWGEGGPLQAILEQRALAFVGAGAAAARRAMHKPAAKAVAEAAGLVTPAWVELDEGAACDLDPPVVVKPTDEGSSFGVVICRDRASLAEALAAPRAGGGVADPVRPPGADRGGERRAVMVEAFVVGRELTVGIVDGRALPLIEIVPRDGFYDFEAKYARDDTAYRFETGLDGGTVAALQREALTIHGAIGGRHLGRVDFLLDDAGRRWFLEINTMPGFTDHSLLPMAAARAGWPMPRLCDRLVRLAINEAASR